MLDEIVINKECRNKGIASAILKNMPEILENQFNEIEEEDFGITIFLYASAVEAIELGFQSDSYKLETKKLINFYKKFGYKVVKENIMVLMK